ncbi:hypothetical protein GS400_17395 [Pontibacillus sp. HMF3514]|nr:hypothetical protein GS400_17395 [Pontibacillus sp. HMF3514]
MKNAKNYYLFITLMLSFSHWIIVIFLLKFSETIGDYFYLTTLPPIIYIYLGARYKSFNKEVSNLIIFLNALYIIALLVLTIGVLSGA